MSIQIVFTENNKTTIYALLRSGRSWICPQASKPSATLRGQGSDPCCRYSDTNEFVDANKVFVHSENRTVSFFFFFGQVALLRNETHK